MFGLRGSDRQRWDEAAKVASVVERRLDDHTTECRDRYMEIAKGMKDLGEAIRRGAEDNDKWNKRLGVGLITLLLAIISSLLRAKGFW